MRIPLALSLASLLAAACSTSKSAAPDVTVMNPTGTPGEAAAQRTEKLSAKVTAVDAATRTLTIQGPDGSTEAVSVPPEVRRFGEIEVGDVIQVELRQGLLLEYQPVGSDTVQPQGVVAGGVAGASSPPGAVVGGGVVATVFVTSIDLKTRIVGFTGPRGRTHQVKAGPGIQLEKLKVGDRLLATYVEAVAISLEKGGSKL